MLKISKTEAKKLWLISSNINSDTTKFKNVLSWIDKFKSNIERKRYWFLELCKKNNLIKEFYYEPKRFLLEEWYIFNWEKLRDITYTPDFKIITNDSKEVYEDTKWERTRKLPDYCIKKKLFIKKYILNKENIDFLEIFDPYLNYFN